MRRLGLRVAERDMKRVIVLFAVCLVWEACSSGDITSPNQIVFPASNVSFSQQVEPYFTLACNVTGCHDAPRSTNLNVDLTSWIAVRDEVPKAGDTLTSPLVAVMFARENHQGVFLANDNQRNGIKVWVLEGARNN